MRRTRAKTTGLLLVAVVLAGGLGACGDDDDKDKTASERPAAAEGEGDTAAFCDNLVEFNSAVLDVNLDDDSSEADIKAAGATVGPLWQDVADTAPDSLADQAETLNDAVQPLNDGDAEAFNKDETFESYQQFVGEAIPECDFESVDVTAVDYAFEGVPATLAAGTFALELTNTSEGEEHEMVIFRKADGETRSIAELLELPEEETEQSVVFKGAAFAPAGKSSSTLAELDPGAYAMACFIPVGGAEDGPPHFTQGMVQEFVVE